MSIPRVNSSASELNDFTETSEGKKVYHVSKSRLIRLINWFQVLKAYAPFVSILLVSIVVVQILYLLYHHRFDFQAFFTNEIAVIELKRPFAFDLGWRSIGLVGVILWYITHREKPVYLIDFATFEPPEDWRLSPEELLQAMRQQECFTEESLQFMERMLKQSGVGPATAWPPGIVRSLKGLPTLKSVEASREESEIVIFDVVQKVLDSTKTKAKDIDILIVNCSLFSPTPSLCSQVINKFRMRSDISSYNLSGMGCSAGLISVELAKNILSSRPNSLALIVSTEIITPNLYHGNERAFLLQNTLFRCGGAAILLSNRWTDAYRAQFKLLHVVRTQFISEESFGCVYETEDEGSHRGVRLSKDIVKVAGRAMEKNFTTLGPYVLPLSEQIKTGISMVLRFSVKYLNSHFKFNLPKVDPYIPDFKRGIDHFCIHAGGRGVIDGIEKNLQLNPWHVEPSRHTLYRYGNTSSSSIWYELNYIRENMKLLRGQRVLQLAFGSGFKCNSSVWLSLQSFRAKDERKEKEGKTD